MENLFCVNGSWETSRKEEQRRERERGQGGPPLISRTPQNGTIPGWRCPRTTGTRTIRKQRENQQPGHAQFGSCKTKEPSRQSARCRQGAGDGRGCGKDRERRHGGQNPRTVSLVPHLRPHATPTGVASDCWQARSGCLSSHQQLGAAKALEPGLSDGRGLLDQ